MFILINNESSTLEKGERALFVSYPQAEKRKTTAPSSTFYFVRTSQNKKSFHFPNATQN